MSVFSSINARPQPVTLAVHSTGTRLRRVARPGPARRRFWLRARVDVAVRSFCLLVGLVLSVANPTAAAAVGTVLVLVTAAGAMSWWAGIAGTRGRAYLYPLVAEAVGALALLLTVTPDADEYVIYVAAAPLLAGLRGGVLRVAAVATAQSLTLVLLQAVPSAPRFDLVAFGGLWLMVGLAAGLLGSWIRELRLRERADAPTPFASAHRLLEQLRTVSRELPGGLDIDVVAENVLATALEALDGDRALLILRSDSGDTVVRAGRWPGAEDILASSAASVTMSMGLQRAIHEPPVVGLPHRHRLSLPLVVGSRSIGSVVVEGSEPATKDMVEAAQRTLDDDAVRLESAVLFADVRAVATVEERQRLAREIHDGVAQEIASLGYLVDDLARDGSPSEHQAGLVDLRRELTRVVSELRLSIFDLRTGVSARAGLGSVLGDYVREVATGSGLAVHLSLEESPERLRLDIETELLRIAQEAVTNARKHARASNVWVTCRIAPPGAEVRVEDDGIGQVAVRTGHYGLHIMGERAHRINAELTIGERLGGGTTVSVVLPVHTTAPPSAPGGSHVLHRAAR